MVMMRRTCETSHNAPDSWREAEEMRDRGCINELILLCISTEIIDLSGATHGDFLLCNDDRSILAPHRDGRMPGARYCLERILC